MEKQEIFKALAELKKPENKKNFSQTYDLIITLQGLDVNTTPLDFFVNLPHMKKQVTIGAFVGQELAEQAAKFCDIVIKENEFDQYKDNKQAVKQLAEKIDFFIGQANLMPKIAGAVGRILGSRGKMPNPKMGGIVPPNANLELLVKKFKTLVRLNAKKNLALQCAVGSEKQPDEEVAENLLAVYNTVMKALPQEKNNIKNVMLKLTMSKPVKVA